MKCKYCQVWQQCDPRLISTLKEGDKNLSHRYCRTKNTRMLAEDDACKDIQVAKYFQCNENNERIAVVTCLYRQNLLKKKPVHSHCSCAQGEDEISELQRGRNLLLEHEYIKPIS